MIDLEAVAQGGTAKRTQPLLIQEQLKPLSFSRKSARHDKS